MFTGIIERTGLVKNISKRYNTYQLTVDIGKYLGAVKKGDSISVNGVCLTAVDIRKNQLVFDLMEETFTNTSFRYIKNRDMVNIERSLGWQSRLEGHFVLGHVDGTRKIKTIRKEVHPYIDISIVPDDKIYIVEKGSIAIEGISLTIAEVYASYFRVYIIPYTLANTNLKYKKTGDQVNIEFDILGKYIHNRESYKNNKLPLVTKGLLESKGFI